MTRIAPFVRMVNRYSLVIVGVALLSGRNGAAQTPNAPLAIGLATGVARAGGVGGGTGYHIVGMFDIPTPLRIIRLRTDGMFADWGGGTRDGRIGAFTAGASLSPLAGSRIAPYTIAGLGAYYTGGVGVRPGWTLGLGVQAKTGMFLEAKLHGVRQRGVQPIHGIAPSELDKTWKYVWIPASLGFRF